MTNEHMAVILAWLAHRITKAETFILEQAPDVIQQIIVMDFVQAISVALCLAMAVPFLLALLWLVWWKTKEKVDDTCMEALDKSFTRSVATFFITLAIIALVVFVSIHSIKALRIHCAPKAYLLERVGVLK